MRPPLLRVKLPDSVDEHLYPLSQSDPARPLLDLRLMDEHFFDKQPRELRGQFGDFALLLFSINRQNVLFQIAVRQI